MAKYYVYNFLKDSFPISQIYGSNVPYYKQISNNGLLYGHEGVDYKTPNGTDIFSPFDGIIVRDGFDGKAYGNYVVIWDPVQKCAVWFCHLQDTMVSVSDKVTKGQLLGHTNNTGNTTGPHVHVNFVETDENGIRLHSNDGEQGFMNILDTNLVEFRPFPTEDTLGQLPDAPLQPVTPPTPANTTVASSSTQSSTATQMPTIDELQTQIGKLNQDLLQMQQQRDDALGKVKEVSDKSALDLQNYTALVASGYTTIDDVNKVLKEVTDENRQTKEQLVEVKKRNEILADQIGKMEKEDYTSIESGINAEKKAHELWDWITAIASAHSTKPTLQAILSTIDSFKESYEKMRRQLNEFTTKQSIQEAEAKAEIASQQSETQPKETAWQFISRLLSFKS